ncbi:MAG: DUF5681 domain-containing protein [Weeksellaceae bacterium]|nr:DUF5681 domain-containing protein [Weeksellaceae bacterium]
MKGKKGFIKGKSGNPAGRPPGKPNKITTSVRTMLKEIMHDELRQLPVTLKSLEPRERIDALAKLLPYVLPKLTEEKEEMADSENNGSFVELVRQQFSRMEGTVMIQTSNGNHYETVEINGETGVERVLE